MDYLDEVTKKMTELLSGLPSADRLSEMDDLEEMAGDYLATDPRRSSPAQYSADLFADPSMSTLVRQDSELKRAVRAETPSEMVERLIPSDGHLE